jgi:hypothetical protein
MEGQTLSLGALGDQVKLWLATINAKKLSGFDESRAERFIREKPLLQKLSPFSFDARKDVPVLVNRESMIRYETNSYSVPPEHIGQLLLLKVHPFEADAEVIGPEGSIRRFPLAQDGSKTKRLFPADREELQKRWDADRARLARVRKPRVPKSQNSSPEVEVRPTSAYEELFADQAMAACL